MRVFTVYKEGGIYAEEHVERLSKQVKEFSGIDLDCITDSPWEHWWSKISLYKEIGPILYMDLDTTVIRDLEPILREVEKHDFIALGSHWRSDWTGEMPTHKLATGITGWKSDAVRHLYDIFVENPNKYIQTLRGDDDFVTENYKGDVKRWQMLNLNWIKSYKYHIVRRKTKRYDINSPPIHSECMVVCYHGLPKPWDINHKTGKICDEDIRSKLNEQ